MNDSEMLLIDAEYWVTGSADGENLASLEKEVEQWILRIAYLENEYGVNRDSDNVWFVSDSVQHRCFFALLMAAALS